MKAYLKKIQADSKRVDMFTGCRLGPHLIQPVYSSFHEPITEVQTDNHVLSVLFGSGRILVLLRIRTSSITIMYSDITPGDLFIDTTGPEFGHIKLMGKNEAAAEIMRMYDNHMQPVFEYMNNCWMLGFGSYNSSTSDDTPECSDLINVHIDWDKLKLV